jgi:hypothetical protein
MPKRKEKIGTATTQVKVGINPSRTKPLGETRTKRIRTPKGAIIIGIKGEITILLKPTSLVPFVVISAITLIISPKSLISNS